MGDRLDEEARTVIARHGPRAHQVVVDAMVAAVRAGDDSRLAEQARLLCRVEELQRSERRAVQADAALP